MSPREERPPSIPFKRSRPSRNALPHVKMGQSPAAYWQFSATTLTDSTTISGGRSTFGSGAASLFALGGSCTGPVTSTFLLTFADHSGWDDPPSTYNFADPPSALFRTNVVPPSVVFACTTQPVRVDLGACAAAAGWGGGCGCAGACSCANTPIAPATVQTAIVEMRRRMSTPHESSFRLSTRLAR